MQTQLAIWDYVPVSEFKAPAPPAVDAARSRIARLWRSLSGYWGADSHAAPHQQAQGNRPTPQTLDILAPQPEWRRAAARLAGFLGERDFSDSQTTQPHYVVLGPPACAVSRILLPLAEQQGWQVLEAPSPQSILADPTAKPTALASLESTAEQVVVIPRLERWFLRHEDGLVLLRQLLERVIHRRQRVVIGCDSWAWAFLQQAIQIEDMLGEPWTLAAFDAARLDAWFRSTRLLPHYTFRRTSDDALLFSELDRPQSDASEPQVDALIRNLAAQARGNPMVAIAQWRASLRTCASDALEAVEETGPLPNAQTRFWVSSLSDSQIPQLPTSVDRIHRFVLQACLLHGGLPRTLLFQLLPFAFHDIQSRVGLLLRSGLLIQSQEQIHIAPSAYPAIRADLQSEGFLTDAL